MLESTLQRLAGAYAPATLRAHRSQFGQFISWCEGQRRRALPAAPDTVCAYLEGLLQRGRRPAGVTHALDSIAALHRFNGLADPTKSPDVRLAVRRMHRRLGRHHRQALGLGWSWVARMLEATGDDLRGQRDRALLRVAYDTLARSSELTSLQVEDLTPAAGRTGQPTAGLTLRRSKTDQESEGCWLPLRGETLAALDQWLAATNLREGPLFRGIDPAGRPLPGLSTEAIALRYRRLARRAGLPEAAARRVSGHSLRVGAAQDLLLSGASLEELMRRGRWRKVSTVMRYVEQAGRPIEHG
jgi:site-specific recombinase XerD